jgi:Flp pilus assembly protein TadD
MLIISQHPAHGTARQCGSVHRREIWFDLLGIKTNVGSIASAANTRMSPPSPESNRWRDVLWALALIVLVFVAYAPAWHGEFVWDDDLAVETNHAVVTPGGLMEIWTSAAADIGPMTFTTFWAEYRLWGATPWAFHLVTILLHGLGGVVLWRVLLRLGAPAAWFGAALWALHPVQAESVAWISETKNTQSGLFFLLSILSFLRWLEVQKNDTRLRWNADYSLMFLFAFLAMASKSSTIILPMVLALCAWWKDREGWWQKTIFVSPLLIFSAVFAAVSMATQSVQAGIANDPMPTRTMPERLVDAGVAIWFYLGKLAWPHPLITIYPAWNVNPGSVLDWLPLIAVFAALTALWALRAEWTRPCFFALAYFVIALLPALGLVDNFIFRFSLIFDHFQYLASMGPLALAAAAFGILLARFGAGKGVMPIVAGIVVLGVASTLTWQRADVFSTQASLWRDTVTQNPGSWLAQANYGQSLEVARNYDEALAHLRTALQIHPTSPETQYNLAATLTAKGETDEALDHFRTALQLYPGFVEAHRGLANVLLARHDTDGAIAEYQAALDIRPDDALSRFGWGNALAQKKDMAGAAEQFRLAVAIDPANAEFHNNLGAAFYQMGRLPEATGEFEEALRLDPHNTDAQANLARAKARGQR